MSKFTEKEVVGLSEVGLGLDELVRHGARQVIQQARHQACLDQLALGLRIIPTTTVLFATYDQSRF
jgi:hypothetical protein